MKQFHKERNTRNVRAVFSRLSLLAISLILFFSQSAFSQIYIDITQVSSKSFPIALVPLFGESKGGDKSPGKVFVETVQRDLELMGVFKFIPESAFLETSQTVDASKIDFARWAVLDALALVKGTFKQRGDRVTLEVRLFDVLLKKELLGKRYETKADHVTQAGHEFADEVLRILTGEPGLFQTQIAFIRGRTGKKDLYVMDFNGDNLRSLTEHKSIVMSPHWTKDGKSIYFTSFRNSKTPQLYQSDVATGNAKRISSFPGMVIGVAFDPITSSIATTLTKDGNSEIYLLGLDGSIRDRLTRNSDIDVSPSFSPDGKQLVFVSNRKGFAQIFRMNRDGNDVTQLTFRGKNNTEPAWSPKGDKILFAGMDDDGQFDIFSMNADGSGMVRLTYDSRNNEQPAWSPDGQMIVFRSNRTGTYQLFTMRPDGSHQIQISKTKDDHSMPSWGPKR